MKKKLLQKISAIGLAVIMTVCTPCITFAEMEEVLDQGVFVDVFTSDSDGEEAAEIEDESLDMNVFEENNSELDAEQQEDAVVFGDGDSSAVSEVESEEIFTSGTEENVDTSDFTYTLDAATGTATITGYTGTSANIVIPGTLIDKGITYRVNEIGDAAFYNNNIIQSVRIENGIESIGWRAFSDCEYLEEVLMSDSIVTLEDGYPGIFENCVRLKAVRLSEGIRTIPECCFRNCSSLNEITIPGNVECIEDSAFELCGSLLRVDFTRAKKLTVIESKAFGDCNLEYVDFPTGFTNFHYTTTGGYYRYFSGNPIKKMIFHENFRGCDSWAYTGVTDNEDKQVIIIYSKNISMNSPEFGSNAEIYGVSGTKVHEMAKNNGNSFYPINAVSNLSADKVDNSTVRLTWNAVSPVARYKIYRAEEINGKYEELGTVSGTEYIDSSAKEDSLNYYKMCVTYIDCLGEVIDGLMSNVVNGDLTRVDIADVDIEEITAIEYTGEEICPKFSASYNGQVLVKGEDYTLSYSNNVEIGRAAITITGINDYKSERIVNFDIIPMRKDIANAIVDSVRDVEYAGKAITPDLTIKYEGTKLIKGEDYTLSYSNNVEIGKAAITITGINDYKSEQVINFNIIPARKDIANATVDSIKDVEYTGREITPDITIQHEGARLIKGEDYTLSYSNNVEIGRAAITITGINDYKSERIVNFDIIPMRKDIAKVTVDAVKDVEYTGKAITPDLTIKYEGAKLIKGEDYQLSYANNIKVGQAKITITGINSYKGSKVVYFKIKNDIPQQPVINSASVVSNKYVNLKWKAVPGATGYRLYRKSNGSSWKTVKTLSGTSFTDKGVKFGQKYTYTVKAYKKVNGKTYWSTYNKTGKTITVTLSAPTLSSAKASGYNAAAITWKKVSGATGYRVYRKVAGSGSYKSVATLKNVSSFTDTKAPGGKTYTYTVRAYKKSGSKTIWGNYSQAGINVKTKMQPRKITLSTNKTYTKYDITGDGKNDKIVLKTKKTNSGLNLTILINGKQAFSYTQKDYLPKKYEVQLCTTSATEEFVSIRYESGENDRQIFHKMYKYTKGKLKSVFDVKKALNIQSMQSSGVERVANKLIVFYAKGISSGGFRNELWPYDVRNGKLYY